MVESMLSGNQNTVVAPRCTLRALLLGLMLLALGTDAVMAQVVPQGCGDLNKSGRFGPYDYRAEKFVPDYTYRSYEGLLNLVESAHFTPVVEGLLSGAKGGLPGRDLTYTLHAFPNHHRALIAMAALSQKQMAEKPAESPYTVECWFQRAVAFKPDDHIVRLLYAGYLIKAKREGDAEQQVAIAAKQANDNPFTHQNVGLVYFDIGNYDLALRHAHKAIELGLNRPELKDQLAKIGKWSEPVPPPVTTTGKSAP